MFVFIGNLLNILLRQDSSGIPWFKIKTIRPNLGRGEVTWQVVCYHPLLYSTDIWIAAFNSATVPGDSVKHVVSPVLYVPRENSWIKSYAKLCVGVCWATFVPVVWFRAPGVLKIGHWKLVNKQPGRHSAESRRTCLSHWQRHCHCTSWRSKFHRNILEYLSFARGVLSPSEKNVAVFMVKICSSLFRRVCHSLLALACSCLCLNNSENKPFFSTMVKRGKRLR